MSCNEKSGQNEDEKMVDRVEEQSSESAAEFKIIDLKGDNILVELDKDKVSQLKIN